MRLFIAADVPQKVREAIAAQQKRLAPALSPSAGRLTWVKPEHSHLTLVFIGDVADERVAAVVDAAGAALDLAAFEISLESVGAFPARGAPRVLWIGIGAGTEPLAALQREMARRIEAVGISLEARPFHPHFTLARWHDARPRDRDRALRAAPKGVIARATIDAATLYQSRLSSAGPSYTPLARATLIRNS